AASRVAPLPHHLLVEPRRVLRDPRRGPEGTDPAPPARAGPGRQGTAGSVRGGESRGARHRRRAVPPAERGAAAGAGRLGRRLPAARGLDPGAAAVDRRVLLLRAAAGPDSTP